MKPREKRPVCRHCHKPMTKHGKYASYNIRKGQRWKCWHCGATKITEVKKL